MSDKILKLSQAQTLYQDLRERINALPTDSDIPEVPVQDVQLNGTTILSEGIANIPMATASSFGVIKAGNGLAVTMAGQLCINPPPSNIIKEGNSEYAAITTKKQHEAVFYGLAKAAGDSTQSASDNTVGTYTDEAKSAIRTMIGSGTYSKPSGGIPSMDLASAITTSLGKADTAYQKPSGGIPATDLASGVIPSVPVTDVQINGTSILSSGIANIPIATNNSTLGVVIPNSNDGIGISNGKLFISSASSGQIKNGSNQYKPIAPNLQHESTFYGLAKAAGDSTQSASNDAVGTYTDSAKQAIQNMLGITSLLSTEESSTATATHAINSIFMMDGKLHRATAAIAIGDAVTVGTNCEVVKADEVFVKNTDIASSSNRGIIKTNANYGTAMRDSPYEDVLMIARAGEYNIKQGIQGYQPIVPSLQHVSVYYGLSKLAGIDLKNEEVTVGTYPETSKTAIRSLVGAAAASDLSNKEDKTVVVTITNTQNQGNTTYTANKTFAQIAAAIEAGKTVIATTESYGWHTYYKLTDYGISTDFPEDSFIHFSREDGQDSTRIRIKYNNTIEYQNTILSIIQNIAINGTNAITNDGIANIPAASADTFGVVKIGNGLGINSNNGKLQVNSSSSANVKIGTDGYAPIVPGHQHEAAFYGLSKAAGVDMSSSSNAVGQYTDSAKIAIRNMIGATSNKVIAVQDEQPTDTDTKIWLPETENAGIQVPTMEDMVNYVQKTDIASSTNYGIVKATNYYGVDMIPTGSDAGFMRIYKAPSDQIKAGVNNYRPIVPSTQHEGVFYGLAKAAGDTTQASSDNAVGTYTDGAKTAIQAMLGVPGDVQINSISIVTNGVANIPIASDSAIGVVKVESQSASGLTVDSTTKGIRVAAASSNSIKQASSSRMPITPYYQHESVFYGLTKAAGVDMSSSSNAVGTYTTEAKNAIQTMLGIEKGIELIETVSGTTPVITGQPNTTYQCGEISTLSITPPANGTIDVFFTSGSTATTLTVPSTIKWPAWFDTETLETDTIYEIMITNGIYGSVMTWQS